MKKFRQIAKTFADGINGRNFVADVNFTAAAIAKISKNTEKIISKNEIVELANKTQYDSISQLTQPETFDDIFTELSDEGLIVMYSVDIKRMTLLKSKEKLTIDEKKELSEIEHEFENPSIGCNEIKLTDIAVNAFKIKHSDVKF